MQISLYNEDTSEYFGIVDLPDDIAEALVQKSEENGYTLEDYIRQIIVEHIHDRIQTLGSGQQYDY
jgi:hypothetical protein